VVSVSAPHGCPSPRIQCHSVIRKCCSVLIVSLRNFGETELAHACLVARGAQLLPAADVWRCKVPDYEQLLEEFYRMLLSPGDVAIDVGAHVGRHTLPMSEAVSPGGRIVAFEPLHFVREDLERAVGDNKDVSVQPFALADREGEEEFVVAVDLPAYSGLRTRIYDAPTRLERIRVQVRTLDGLFADMDRLDYIKIDAEGGELGILRGASGLIERLAPVVTFEFGANSLGGYGLAVEDMANYWLDKPYAIYDILARRLDPQQFAESAIRQEVWDYVALPLVRAESIVSEWCASR
jgi:FkbM family methyltransferase